MTILISIFVSLITTSLFLAFYNAKEKETKEDAPAFSDAQIRECILSLIIDRADVISVIRKLYLLGAIDLRSLKYEEKYGIACLARSPTLRKALKLKQSEWEEFLAMYAIRVTQKDKKQNAGE